jgi:glycosyltransferase involved in cell wall biosynthesis
MPNILYLVTEDWFFVSHFLPTAVAAREAGFDVTVASRMRDHAERIEKSGFRTVHVDFDRERLGPLHAMRIMVRLVAVIRTECPQIVHCIAIKPVALGGLAARVAGADRLVLALTGLGTLWSETNLFARFARIGLKLVIGKWLRKPGTRYLFDNEDDPLEFGLRRQDNDVTVVGGAGVSAVDFPSVPEPPAPPVKLAVVSRMILPKGIAEAVEATRRARRLGADVELHLFGKPDESNRRSIPEQELRRWMAEPGIHWHGHTADVARIWREHHVAVLLSYYREGVPRALIEAAASGRPIITTEAPGCRDVVRHGHEGLVVPIGDVDAAARAILKLASDPALRARLGAGANARFQERFTEEAVKRVLGNLYRSLGDQRS